MKSIFVENFEQSCKDVSEYWGDRMPMMLMEEAGELIQAVSKVERKGLDFEKQNLIDEIGDMYISLMAIRARYEISENDVEKRIEHKLNKKY